MTGARPSTRAVDRHVVTKLYKAATPFLGGVVRNERLTPEARGTINEVRHLIIDARGYPYVPGQSVGVIPPGIDPRTGRAHKLRLYSIASPAGGEHGYADTFSLCVVRHFWDHPESGQRMIPGVCSNYLCDLSVGDEVRLTGPVGNHFLLPDPPWQGDLLMLAVGTGVAPFRGMLAELHARRYTGKIWLFFGTKYRDTLLYHHAFHQMREIRANFHYITACSREESNPCNDVVPTRGGRMYVQAKFYQHGGEIADSLAKEDTLIYICGLKGMDVAISRVLDLVGREKGISDHLSGKLKKEKRLRIEVY